MKIIEKTIDKYKLFSKNDKILVACSGGKDSQFLVYSLKKLGYKIDCFFIDLGIPIYSGESYNKVEELTNMLDLDLIKFSLKENYNLTIPEITKKTKRPVCSFCGIIKRYIMNKYAFEKGYNLILTGHTINDNLRILMNSLFNWNLEYIYKIYPCSERKGNLVKKAKPLFFVWESDILKEIEKEGIPYVNKQCPLSKRAKKKELTQIIECIEKIKGKSYLEQFLKGYLKRRKLFKIEYELKPCKICGYLCGREICSFCKIINFVKK